MRLGGHVTGSPDLPPAHATSVPSFLNQAVLAWEVIASRADPVLTDAELVLEKPRRLSHRYGILKVNKRQQVTSADSSTRTKYPFPPCLPAYPRRNRASSRPRSG